MFTFNHINMPPFKAQKLINIINRRLLNSANKQSPYKGKQWMLLTTATRSYSKEGPQTVVSTSFKGGQKVMAIRRLVLLFVLFTWIHIYVFHHVYNKIMKFVCSRLKSQGRPKRLGKKSSTWTPACSKAR